jgi:putative ABC transport system permease protein
VLTSLGTVLGVGAFVAVLGLTSTASGQIGRAFTTLSATTVTVTDSGAAGQTGTAPGTEPPMDFPPDADRRVDRIDGVVAAGVWWPVPVAHPRISAAPGGDGATGQGLAIYAATPGAIAAMGLTLSSGVTLDPYAENTRQHVALISAAGARQLGVTRLDAQPAVFVNGIPYTVIGVYSSTQRLTQTQLGMLIPAATALDEYGNPGAATDPAQMVVATRLGAAQVVAAQIAAALRPDATADFQVSAPPDPHSLRDRVNDDLAGLFLAMAGICLLIGAVGIANTTLVSVLERTSEIGLRRALGARPRHITAQFLAESATLGTLGGLIGTSLGVVTVLGVAAAESWTTVLQPAVTLPAPLVGTAVGLAAGIYPAWRASRASPLDALRA